ncbi:MAG TPA: PH domain-containing protein [Methanomicrobiales archaeon]|jgi:membrane protein YdbS with pleckstrin-like domain|nr:PH domain-containing protein [Methanomicrobiales archaeon]
MPSEHFPLNKLFKPSPSLVTWFRVDFLIAIFCLVAFLYLPVGVFGEVPSWASPAVLGAAALAVILFFVWVGMYYDSMWYELRDDEMNWKRGVWFRRTGIVPYNRITNLDLVQGPVMRALGISTLSIQTAGYSGQATPEIRIEAIEHAEELRELVRTLVRGHSGGDGTGTGAQVPPSATATTDIQVLEELKKIRLLLEKGR